MSDPNHQVIWKPIRPDFSITYLRSTSTNRGYHETWYEVVSRRRPLAPIDFRRLDECSLLGMGQAYHVESESVIVDAVPPVTIDRRTGEVLDVPPVGYNGEVITKLTEYQYYRYVVKRILVIRGIDMEHSHHTRSHAAAEG